MVQEDEAGSLQTSVEDIMARGRRRRFVGRLTMRLSAYDTQAASTYDRDSTEHHSTPHPHPRLV